MLIGSYRQGFGGMCIVARIMHAAGRTAQRLVMPRNALPIRVRSPVDNPVALGGDIRHRFHLSCRRVSDSQYQISSRSKVRISLFPSGYLTLLVTVVATNSISGSRGCQLGNVVQQLEYRMCTSAAV